MIVYLVKRTTSSFFRTDYSTSEEIVGIYSIYENARDAISISEKIYPTYIDENDSNEYERYRVYEIVIDDYSVAKESRTADRIYLSKTDIYDSFSEL